MGTSIVEKIDATANTKGFSLTGILAAIGLDHHKYFTWKRNTASPTKSEYDTICRRLTEVPDNRPQQVDLPARPLTEKEIIAILRANLRKKTWSDRSYKNFATAAEISLPTVVSAVEGERKRGMNETVRRKIEAEVRRRSWSVPFVTQPITTDPQPEPEHADPAPAMPRSMDKWHSAKLIHAVMATDYTDEDKRLLIESILPSATA